MALQTKAELLALPIWQLTSSQFSWIYEQELFSVHSRAVKDAFKKGLPVPENVLKEFPYLRKEIRDKQK